MVSDRNMNQIVIVTIGVIQMHVWSILHFYMNDNDIYFSHLPQLSNRSP